MAWRRASACGPAMPTLSTAASSTPTASSTAASLNNTFLAARRVQQFPLHLLLPRHLNSRRPQLPVCLPARLRAACLADCVLSVSAACHSLCCTSSTCHDLAFLRVQFLGWRVLFAGGALGLACSRAARKVIA